MERDCATAASGAGWPAAPLRVMLNAIFYLVRNGCPWCNLPHHLPPWQTVYTQLLRWRKDGTWETLNAALVKAVRQVARRAAAPSAAVIDSQSVKTREGEATRGGCLQADFRPQTALGRGHARLVAVDRGALGRHAR